MVFERVFTVTDFDNGPRGGIADFEGHPHRYECEWNDGADTYASTFRLHPVTPEILAMALEDSGIWERWWTAFQEGHTTQDTHPALPEDRARHEELERGLDEQIRLGPSNSLRALGEFRTAVNWDGRGPARFEVRWERCEELDTYAHNQFATFWRRFAAMWIDFLIFLPLALTETWLESLSKSAALVLAVPYTALAIGYSIYGHGRFGQTVGKWLMAVRVVRIDGARIGWREAWLRSSVDLFLSAFRLVGQFVALATIADAEYYGAHRAESILAHEPRWAVWAGWVGVVWFWSEVVTMLLNKRRRALHDLIAGTVVVHERRIAASKHGAEQVDEDDPAAGTLG
jgi:uncharacterized RDD family membrane protein YckC